MILVCQKKNCEQGGWGRGGYSSNAMIGKGKKILFIGEEKAIEKISLPLWFIYTVEYQPSEKLPFTSTWMKLEGIMLIEISQSDKDNYHMVSVICGT